jgi:aspartyl-tRNA(Asn)/glutamyl-tRNA(Gln) amidotransferase subunit A
VSIGYDGGGSIRTPASLSGVLGLATGYGRFPFSSHMQGTLIKAGPFANKIADVALAYAVMARHSAEHNFFGEM